MDNEINRLPSAPRPPTIDGRIHIAPFALDEGERWFPALRFILRGQKLGDDLVLREKPYESAMQAKAVANLYVSEAYK